MTTQQWIIGLDVMIVICVRPVEYGMTLFAGGTKFGQLVGKCRDVNHIFGMTGDTLAALDGKILVGMAIVAG